MVGQDHRSKVKVMRSKNGHADIPLISESQPKMKLRNRTGRNTMWGVFKAYVFFYRLISAIVTSFGRTGLPRLTLL